MPPGTAAAAASPLRDRDVSLAVLLVSMVAMGGVEVLSWAALSMPAELGTDEPDTDSGCGT